ncbi:hypothetical protein DFH07DRAFT_775404 [Mycena maculata]|uniref:Uncharacterized protein n=1 Tax=Mycena maculata TaxID=230809 RepID=A0AAD7IVI0_9AGAR|nr:hypothetical protein DFH07DRAFT_775404 [Mycena maculata]
MPRVTQTTSQKHRGTFNGRMEGQGSSNVTRACNLGGQDLAGVVYSDAPDDEVAGLDEQEGEGDEMEGLCRLLLHFRDPVLRNEDADLRVWSLGFVNCKCCEWVETLKPGMAALIMLVGGSSLRDSGLWGVGTGAQLP